MKPATYKVLNGQDTMELKETSLDLLYPVNINFFNPFFIDNSIPASQTGHTIVRLGEAAQPQTKCNVQWQPVPA